MEGKEKGTKEKSKERKGTMVEDNKKNRYPFKRPFALVT